MFVLQNDNDEKKALEEISESLKQIADNTKKEKKEPNYILNFIWVVIGIAIIYILWKVQRMVI